MPYVGKAFWWIEISDKMKIFALKKPEHIKHEQYIKIHVFLVQCKYELKDDITNPKIRSEKLISATFLRSVLRDCLKCNIKELRIETDQFEKPYLPQHPDFHFNLSHSGDYLVCVTDCSPIGIDIERVRKRDFDSIKQYFYSTEEIEYMDQCSEDKKEAAFFDIWTRKESYVKAIGKGLSIDFKSFTTINIGKKNSNFHIDTGTWQIKTYNTIECHPMAVCASHGDFPDTIQFLDFNKTISNLSHNTYTK